ncbi:protein-serine O-palmitoleoyltransferase porcupine [Microplitis mediator]|uniref:protein-serine O-palmitoleoyltransferase porcupine n=1 Tax=Microplitis mediator TaxID=375433 RepID=UPI00255389D1|nr:protein-serine O-palmitoleoyltransferase porcupine [Microplitis mediator]
MFYKDNYDNDMSYYDDDENDCFECNNYNLNYKNNPPNLDVYDDYDYLELNNSETFLEILNNCVFTSINATSNFSTLFVANILLRILMQFMPSKIYHIISVIIGIFIINYYAHESLLLMFIYTLLSYLCLRVPKKYQSGIEMFIITLLTILYCEYSMDPVSWHRIRGILMIAAMKAVSISLDSNKNKNLSFNIWEYTGYIFSPITCIFGPWISFNNYKAITTGAIEQELTIRQISSLWLLDLGNALKNFTIALIFLSISNCFAQWLIPNYISDGKWFTAYGDALSFRSSHYFICYVASTVLSLGGVTSLIHHQNTTPMDSISPATITRPIDIELPRSLVQVVISWNIPMHTWLKSYIFRPSVKHVGKFNAVILTYLTSSLLHGLNFQIAAVLLSLGLYTYIEFKLRNHLANTFNICIGSRQCNSSSSLSSIIYFCGGTKCHYPLNSKNSIKVLLINFGFSLLAVFHLAYLGLMFDTSELQETGYNYSHTIDKWSQLGFASHLIALSTYITYYLII